MDTFIIKKAKKDSEKDIIINKLFDLSLNDLSEIKKEIQTAINIRIQMN